VFLKGHLWNPLIISWDIFLALDDLFSTEFAETVAGDISETFQDLLP
jgi:hypothetical protein